VNPVTAYSLAERFSGIQELNGSLDNPQIMAMLKLDNSWPQNDEVPWCSAFVNYICWLLRLPRSKDLRARSWLEVGTPIDIKVARPGWDVVIFKRGTDHGPEVIDAPGHVGFYAGHDDRWVEVLGGNQGNTVKVSRYPLANLLSVRTLV
jgi:uncharacterized protein (TIGR02594 family)